MTVLAAILSSICFAVAGQVCLKTGMNRAGRVGRRARVDLRAAAPFVALGLASYFTSMLLWLFTLSRVELSYAFPFVSLSYVAILVIARQGLGESLDRTRWTGSGLIVLGVLLVGWSGCA